LKSPLRGIDQLAAWLDEDLKDKIDDESQEKLQLIRSRIVRMNTLLNDLLQYAQASISIDHQDLVDTRQILQGIYDLSGACKKFTFNLIGDFPHFKTLGVPFAQVFRNLIDNGIKHHGSDSGTMTITVVEQRLSYVFTVEDDGPGIDALFRDRVFELFQTLKPRDEVEGSGLGLAIVKKILHSVGGDVDLRPNQPTGARFIITWPKEIVYRTA